jgi:hypothetical protein
MLFAPHEKSIYQPEGSDKRFDPLLLHNALVVASGGRLNELLVAWSASSDNLGDVSQGSQARSAVMSAEAEMELARVARKVFGLPDFPEATDGEALELLDDYCRWMEGKGVRAGKPPRPPEHSLEVSSPQPTLISSGST